MFVLVCAAANTSAAATLDIAVTDQSGRPAADAVIALTPERPDAVASHLPEKAIVDQERETFLPLVVLVRQGGRVVFTNHDVTMHQVYSFSAIKKFQFIIAQGEVSDPVQFDDAGVAAIGCNIHDQMIAYVYVGAAPFAAITDAKGHAAIADLPDGRYHVEAWQPQLPAGTPRPSSTLDVAGRSASLAVSLPLSLQPSHGMKHMHMGY